MKDFTQNIIKKIQVFFKDIDKDLNRIIAFILTILSVYLCFNRFLESIIILFTGAATSYFSNLMHIISLTVIVLAYFIVIESNNVKYKINDDTKLNIFHFYAFLFIIYFVSMTVEISNRFFINYLFGSFNFIDFIKEDIRFIKPALSSISFATMYFMYFYIHKMYKKKVAENNDTIYSIVNARGISLNAEIHSSDDKYTEDTYFFKIGNTLDNKAFALDAPDIFKHVLVLGDPEIRNKYFIENLIYSNVQKKVAFQKSAHIVSKKLLEEGIATIKPEFFGQNLHDLNFNMLMPANGMENEFKEKTADITTIDGISEKDLGITIFSENKTTYNNVLNIVLKQKDEVQVVNPDSTKSIGLNPFASNTLEDVSRNVLNLLNIILKENKYTISYSETKVFIKNTIYLLSLTYPATKYKPYPNLKDLLKLMQNLNFLQILVDQLKIKYLDLQDNVDFTKSNNSKKLKLYEEVYTYFENNIFKKQISEDANNSESNQQKIFRDIMAIVPALSTFLNHNKLANIFTEKSENIDFIKLYKSSKTTLVYIDKEDKYTSSILREYLRYIITVSSKDRSMINMQNPHFVYIENFAPYLNNIDIENFKRFTKEYISFIVGLDNLYSLENFKSANELLHNLDNKIYMLNKSADTKDILNAADNLGINVKTDEINAYTQYIQNNPTDVLGVYKKTVRGRKQNGFAIFKQLENETNNIQVQNNILSEKKQSNLNINKENIEFNTLNNQNINNFQNRKIEEENNMKKNKNNEDKNNLNIIGDNNLELNNLNKLKNKYKNITAKPNKQNIEQTITENKMTDYKDQEKEDLSDNIAILLENIEQEEFEKANKRKQSFKNKNKYKNKNKGQKNSKSTTNNRNKKQSKENIKPNNKQTQAKSPKLKRKVQKTNKSKNNKTNK